MAAPTKKRALTEEMKDLEERGDAEGSSDNDSVGKEDMSDELVDQEIQVEFEARNADDNDFHGMRKLLQQLFLKANVNLSELTDTLIGQNYVGSVIKQVPLSEEDEDDDMDDDSADVYGLISCLNVTDRKQLECVKQIVSLVLEKCEKYAQKHLDKLSTIVNDESSHVGLLLSERFINIPAQIALPSYDSLWKELDKATKKKMKYSFGHYLMISKTYQLPDVAGSAASKKLPISDNVKFFVNPEEEYFQEEAMLSFDYSVKHERDTIVGGLWDDETDEFDPFRTVMVIPSDRIPTVMGKMRENLSVPGN